jgi:hypothetical protein
MTAPLTIPQLEAELTRAHYDNWGTDAEVEIGRRLAEAKEAADKALKARRLRTKALDLRARYDSLMADYGREIGRAQTIKDPTVAKLVASAAKAALDLASDCLTQALAAEREADEIDRPRFVILFDGVSANRVSTQPHIIAAE